MTEFASLKKIHTKITIVKRNIRLNDPAEWSDLNDLTWMIWLVRIYLRLIFQTLYHTSLISPKREIDETVNFRNFRQLFQINFSRFLFHFGTPFSNGKNEKKWQGTWKHAAMAVTCT